ncbi:MAG: ZIP family metal transporter [Candidatus Micrarchaeales archaeon]
MINTYLTISLSFVMGLAIFLSMPIVFHKKTGTRRIIFFNAIAIGILVFLLMDIFGDVSALFGNVPLSPLELIFIVGFVLAFLFFIIPKRNRQPHKNPKRTSLLAAMGIGFQNLTEGLVFGSAGAAGLASIYIVSLIGFTLQNISEGFPIAAPLVGLKKLDKKFVTGAFILGGAPTVIGTLIGLVFYSSTFIVFFDALASAAILYVVLVLFHVNIHKGMSEGKGFGRAMWLTYFGILIGFAIAFVVNYI